MSYHWVIARVQRLQCLSWLWLTLVWSPVTYMISWALPRLNLKWNARSKPWISLIVDQNQNKNSYNCKMLLLVFSFRYSSSSFKYLNIWFCPLFLSFSHSFPPILLLCSSVGIFLIHVFVHFLFSVKLSLYFL